MLAWMGFFPVILCLGFLSYFVVYMIAMKLAELVFHYMGKDDDYINLEEKLDKSRFFEYTLIVWWLFLIVCFFNGFNLPSNKKELSDFAGGVIFLGVIAWVYGKKGHLWAALVLIIMIILLNVLFKYHLI